MTSAESAEEHGAPAMQARSGAAFDRVIGNTASAGTAAWLTVMTGSPEGAAILGGAIGPLVEEFSFALRKIINVRNRQVETMAGTAAEVAGLPLDDLLERLTGDRVKMELLVVALEAAGRATSEGKLKLIGHLVASGALADDRAVVDDQLLALKTISELETPHFRLMLLLTRHSPEYLANPSSVPEFAWQPDRIVEADPGLKTALPVLIARLTGLGLAQQSVEHYGVTLQHYLLTPFGWTCIEVVRERGSSFLDSAV